MKISNSIYNSLKFLVQTALPALSTLVFAMFEIWHLDMALAAEICGTIAAFTTFLGVLIGISKATYLAERKEDEFTY